LTHESISI